MFVDHSALVNNY